MPLFCLTWSYWVLLGLIESYWVLLGLTGFLLKILFFYFFYDDYKYLEVEVWGV